LYSVADYARLLSFPTSQGIEKVAEFKQSCTLTVGWWTSSECWNW